MSWMIAGLGNPGPEYTRTRHNAGFLVIDSLGEDLSAAYWKNEAGALTSSAVLDGDSLLLVKPLTYMNVSGKAIAKLAAKYEYAVDRIVVVHDDIDIPNGSLRVKAGGGHAGHNGLRSITDELGSEGYIRVRIGVGRPEGRMSGADYVLQPLRGEAWEDLQVSIGQAAECVKHLLAHGVDSAMREFNSKQ
ncbi:MAG: aminoacyl-tRNA hydrolase [Actinobacteria bacterium]|nr:aminoacyl-tRNA hydrolase [Actinomycetota bacterium]